MMKKYQRQRKNSPNKTVTFLCVVTLSLMVVAVPGVREPLVSFITGSLTYHSLALAVDAPLEDITESRSDLIAQIEALEAENQKLELENIASDVISIQNEALKDQLGRVIEESEESTAVLARVTSRPPLSPYDTLMIDLGKEDGLARGDVILSSDTVEIGTVTEVYESSSRVELYSSAGVRTPVEINGEGALYVAEGQGGGEVTVNVPHSVEVEPGDTLTTPSADAKILAVVRDIEVEETDPFTLVLGRLPVNIFELSWVLVEKK